MSAANWPGVAEIYAAGIASGNATFEAKVPSWQQWQELRGELPSLVASDSEKVIGWAALTPVSPRRVYRGVAAISIYVDPAHVRKGIGKALLLGLIDAAEQAGIWTLEAGIFPENAASIALHRSCGFRFVGVREKVGQMRDGSWRDVRLFEHRSALPQFA